LRAVQEAEVRHLEVAMSELERLAQLFDVSRDRVAKGKPGARVEALIVQFLVTELDRILIRFTDKKITRSTKRPATRQYVEVVCKIADPKIGRGSIDAAMKRQIASRGKIRR